MRCIIIVCGYTFNTVVILVLVLKPVQGKIEELCNRNPCFTSVSATGVSDLAELAMINE